MMSAYSGGAAAPSITTFGSGVLNIAKGVGVGLVTLATLRPSAATGVHVLQRLKTAAAIHRMTVGRVSAAMSAYGTVESIYHIRKGGYEPAYKLEYVPYDPFWIPPFPVLGEIPGIRPRLTIGAEKKESRSDGHIGRTDRVAGPSQTRKTMRGASAKKKRSRKPKFVRYRKGGCPPGYSYDPKRKMCIHNSYR